jgi:DNA-binding transcriptional ArsR family regulator
MQTDLISLAQQQAEIYKTFSNSTRILILWSLSESELSVSEIANAVNASIQNTSHHLRIMKDRGILEARRQGQTIFYAIQNREIVQSLLNKCPEISGEIYFER